MRRDPTLAFIFFVAAVVSAVCVFSAYLSAGRLMTHSRVDGTVAELKTTFDNRLRRYLHLRVTFVSGGVERSLWTDAPPFFVPATGESWALLCERTNTNVCVSLASEGARLAISLFSALLFAFTAFKLWGLLRYPRYDRSLRHRARSDNATIDS